MKKKTPKKPFAAILLLIIALEIAVLLSMLDARLQRQSRIRDQLMQSTNLATASRSEAQRTSAPQTNSESETVTDGADTQIPIKPFENSASSISLTEYGHGTFSIPASIQSKAKITLKWTSDQPTTEWGNTATVCLIGLDDQKQPIKLKENKGLCYPDAQLSLATTALSSGEYTWLSSDYKDKFITPPKSYQLSIRVLDSLPSEGRSEWAGLISESTSNEFIFK